MKKKNQPVQFIASHSHAWPMMPVNSSAQNGGPKDVVKTKRDKCHGSKTTYPTQKAAAQAAIHLRRKSAQIARSYYCVTCEGWHLTRWKSSNDSGDDDLAARSRGRQLRDRQREKDALQSVRNLKYQHQHQGNDTMSERQSGTVKWFNVTKGFGFIKPTNGDKDIFVHISAVEAAGLSKLDDGQSVEYDLKETRDGRFAAENLSEAA